MSVLMMILAAILLLGPLVAIHEFGHYWVARLLGVKVLVYSIGFGPQLVKWQSKKTGIIYQLAALPLGGYVKMLDEREPLPEGQRILDEDLPRAFNRQSVWKRFLIVFAGPAINLIFAVLLFWILFLPAQEQLTTRIGKVLPNTPAAEVHLQQGDKIIAIDGRSVDTWEKVFLSVVDRAGETGHIQLDIERQEQHLQVQLPIQQFLKTSDQSPLDSLGFLPYRPPLKAIIGEVMADGAAGRQGMQTGDEIIKINQKPMQDWYDVVNVIRASPEVLLTIEVLRQGQALTLKVMPQARYEDGQRYGSLGVKVQTTGRIEIPADYKQTIHYSPTQAFMMAVEKTGQMSGMIVGSIVKMIKGWIGLDNLSGPITVAKVAGQTAELGWKSFLAFMAMMSVSLGILNLLPIPMLDGGHLVYYLIEAIRGKPVSEQIQILGFKIGMILLGGMMLLALFNDFMRL